MWIGTTEGLYCWADGRLEGAVSGLPKAGIECLYADTDGSLWISLDQAYGLYLHAPDGDLSRPALGLPEGAIVKALLRDASSRLWVATRDHGAFRLDGGKLWGGVASGELPERKINAVVSDPSGAVWLATDGGIWRDSGGSWENLSEREGLANNLVEALLVDREGNVWAGTSRAGLVKLSGSKVLNFTAKEGLLPGAVNAVWADADGSIWIGGDGGLSLLRGGSVRPSPESELLKGVRVRHIMRDSRGTLWISSYGEGALYELPASGGYRTHGVGDGLPGQRVRMSLEDSRGRIWVATTTGLALREGDGWRSLTRERGLSLDYILGLAEAKDGSILAVTDGGGVNRIDPDTLEVVGQWKAPDGVAAGVVFKALPRGDAVWLATASGLTLRGPAGVRHFGRRDGLPADAIFDIVPDGEGLLWLSSSAGLVAIDEADALSGSLTITMALGANAGISGGLTAASWGCGSPDGRLWFPGVAGAVSLDPRRIPTNDTPPLMVIEAAELDGAYVAPVTVSIAPGVKRVVFRYTGLSFVDPESVRFRTKLEGFDDDWSYMEDRREQSYTNLPPGEYR